MCKTKRLVFQVRAHSNPSKGLSSTAGSAPVRYRPRPEQGVTPPCCFKPAGECGTPTHHYIFAPRRQYESPKSLSCEIAVGPCSADHVHRVEFSCTTTGISRAHVGEFQRHLDRCQQKAAQGHSARHLLFVRRRARRCASLDGDAERATR